MVVELTDKPAKQATALRQASLVDAAVRLAAHSSPATITTTDLAHAVGITQGAVFRHFASKEAIWLAVLDWTQDALMTRLLAASKGHTDPLLALRAVFLTHVDFAAAHPGMPRVIFQELQHAGDTPLKARVRDLMQDYRQLVMRLLTAAQIRQGMAQDTDLSAATVMFIGAVQGLVMQSLISGQADAMATLAPGVFEIYRRGVVAAPGPLLTRGLP